MDDLLDSYLELLRVTKSEDTYESYGNRLRPFRAFVESYGSTMGMFTMEDVLAFLSIHNEDWSENTKNLFIATVKGYAKFCSSHVTASTDPVKMQNAFDDSQRLQLVRDMQRMKVPRHRKVKSLTIDEVSQLLHAAHERCMTRTWMRIWLMFYTGARKKELMRLDSDAIDLEAGMVTINTMKTLIDRVYYVEPKGTMEIIRLLKNGELDFGRNPETLNKMLQNVQRLTNIELTVTPHVARHTFNTEMRKTLGDDILVKTLMGHHGGSDMTATYTSFNEDDLRKAMTTGHYLKGLFPLIAKWVSKVPKHSRRKEEPEDEGTGAGNAATNKEEDDDDGADDGEPPDHDQA